MLAKVTFGLLLIVSASAFAEPLYDAENDYLSPELRAKVEALKADAAQRPTTLQNLRERVDILWPWANALSEQGVHIPVELPRIVSQSRQLDARPNATFLILPFVTNAVRELQVKEEWPEAIGEVTTTADGPYVAESYVTFEQTYTVGEMPMQPGGAVMVAWELVARLSPYQRQDPSAKNYITIRSSNTDAVFENDSQMVLGMHGNIFGAVGLPVYRLKGTRLQPGDTITITYGNTSGGSLGLQLQTTEVDAVLFPLYIDLEGKGNYFSPEWPSLRVVGGRAVRVRAFAPSIVEPGEPFELAIRTEDTYYNRATLNVPRYVIRLNGKEAAWTAAPETGLSVIGDLNIEEPGVYRYEVTSEDGSIRGLSNPIWVQENPKYRIYWGDTHAHTNMAEAQGTLENFYRFAREDARLDFIALSEHDVWMEDNEWERLKAGVKRYNEEGRFLALLSYEWTAIVDYGGHHNVLFRTPKGRRRVPIQETEGLWALLEGLKADNDPEDVLVIPHAHIPGDWRIADPKLERVVEVLSMHGTFEWFGNYYLQNGHMIGFVGASDDHSGRPGYSGPFRNGPLQQFSGLGAVMAPELTTDAVFDALRNISAYATSGQRTILDLRLNGTPMGKRLKFTKQRKIEGRVMATSPIDTIEVVKNSKVVHTERASLRPGLADGWVQVSFGSASEDLIRDAPRGHRIWRGTLDVKNAKLKGVNPLGHNDVYSERVAIDDSEPNRINFRLVTRGRDDSFLLDLAGVSEKTELVIHTEPAPEEGVTFPRFYQAGQMPETNLTLSFADLEDGHTATLLPVGRYTDRVAAQLVNPNGPMDYDFSYTDEEEPHDGDYYYVRIKQLDGDMAWSSPWWVGGIPPR